MRRIGLIAGVFVALLVGGPMGALLFIGLAALAGVLSVALHPQH